MTRTLVGNEFLRERLATGAFPLARPAAIFPLTKVTAMADYFQVPGHVAPVTGSPLEHLLFARKHEGLERQAAALGLQKICIGGRHALRRVWPANGPRSPRQRPAL